MENIRQELEAARFAIDLAARERVALLAVAVTVGAGAAVSSFQGQLAALPAATLVLLASGAAVLQVRALRQLSTQWASAWRAAKAATDMLIAAEGDSDDDGEEADLGGR
jgi:hypothetical protein